jgi:hypothetical protein
MNIQKRERGREMGKDDQIKQKKEPNATKNQIYKAVPTPLHTHRSAEITEVPCNTALVDTLPSLLTTSNTQREGEKKRERKGRAHVTTHTHTAEHGGGGSTVKCEKSRKAPETEENKTKKEQR